MRRPHIIIFLSIPACRIAAAKSKTVRLPLERKPHPFSFAIPYNSRSGTRQGFLSLISSLKCCSTSTSIKSAMTTINRPMAIPTKPIHLGQLTRFGNATARLLPKNCRPPTTTDIFLDVVRSIGKCYALPHSMCKKGTSDFIAPIFGFITVAKAESLVA